jgi:hypothetical protein
VLLEAAAPGHALVGLRSKAGDARVVEAARDVIAHAWAIVRKHDDK